jgi:hypothetical protein
MQILFGKTKPICRALAGNTKFEYLNPEQAEKGTFEKTKPMLKWAKWC